MHRRLLPAFRRFWISVLLLTTIASPATAASTPWLKLEALGFTLYSDAREKDVVACALHYAAFRQAFANLFVPPGRALPSSTLLLFRSQSAFYEFVPARRERDPHSRLSNFSNEIDGAPLNAFSLANGRDQALALSFEFETVWALRRLGYHVPVWMSQGAGEVLSTLSVRKNQFRLGEAVGHDTDFATPWPRFFATGTDSKAYQSLEDLPRFLNQAWGVMHWVLLSGEHSRERFTALATRLAHTDASDALSVVMQTPSARFARAIRAHLRADPVRRVPFDATATRAAFRLSSAPPAEVLVYQADLLASSGETAQANLLLDQALQLAPDLPLVLEASARRLLLKGHRYDALLAYRAAINAGTRNPLSYLRSAEGRLDDVRRGAYDVLGDGGHEAELALAELRQALKLDPHNADAYLQLGRAFFVLPKVTPALLDELTPGVTPDLDGARVRYYRAMLLARLSRHDDAIADLRAIADDASLDNSVRDQARERIASETLNRDLARAESLLRAQDYNAVRKLAAAGAAHAKPADAARYHQLVLLAHAEEAWDALAALTATKRWPEVHAAAEKYVAEFPGSRHLNDAYDLLIRSAFPERAEKD